jgi:hypothetical protein
MPLLWHYFVQTFANLVGVHMKNRSTVKISIKHELGDLVMFCVGETKSLFKFVVLLLVAYFANFALNSFSATGYTRIAFQVIESTALVLGSVEYLGSRAIEAWNNLKNSASKAKS